MPASTLVHTVGRLDTRESSRYARHRGRRAPGLASLSMIKLLSVRRIVLLVAALAALRVLAPVDADAQFLYLTLDNGRVMLYAQDVSLQQVLERWSLAGGATVVNAERVANVPMNLQIAGVSEREALSILLRRVG